MEWLVDGEYHLSDVPFFSLPLEFSPRRQRQENSANFISPTSDNIFHFLLSSLCLLCFLHCVMDD
jgi:hypothetical protein